MNENLNLALNNFVEDLKKLLQNSGNTVVEIISKNKTTPKKIPIVLKSHYTGEIKTIYEKHLAAFKSDLPKYQNDLNKKIKTTIESSPVFNKLPLPLKPLKSIVVESFTNIITNIILSFNVGFGISSLKQLKNELHYLLRLK